MPRNHGHIDDRTTMHAAFTTTAVNIDGKLDDPVWQTAPAYQLNLSRDKQAEGAKLAEHGWVQLAHDDDNLYIAIRFDDSDVVSEGDSDQLHHYRLGDVAEVFLKPVAAEHYWELYLTPRGYKTVFFYPSRCHLGLPSSFEAHDVGLRVAADVQGSTGDWHDRDTGWAGEMAIAKAKLSAMGVPVTPDQPWTILIGRYNYSRYLHNVEHSMCPSLSTTNFHLVDEYAPLILGPTATVQEPVQ